MNTKEGGRKSEEVYQRISGIYQPWKCDGYGCRYHYWWCFPILGLFGGMNFDQLKWNILGEVTLNYGKFISAVLNFLIMALVIFTLMRVMNSAAEKLNHNKEEKPAEPTTKKCHYCKTEIAIDATRCPHCTSVLEEIKETK